MPSDGGLRQLFSSHIPDFHWQSIETGSTGRGIPDTNYCYEGREGWIEFKATSGRSVGMRTEQVGWIERRLRAGGRVFIAIRRKHDGGPRLGKPIDDLYLFRGLMARALMTGGVNDAPALFLSTGGPAKWDWAYIRGLLLGN